MKTTFEWEVIPTAETHSYFVETDKDCILEAAKKFVETWGDGIKVRAIRKASVKTVYEEAV